jgi:2-phospho-L-lactate guanylyltransferase
MFEKSKMRLSEVLKPQERQTLTLTMLEDVLRAVTGSLKVDRTVVVSPDSKAQEFANNFGASYLPEKEQGLNQAVDQATRWCIQNDAKSVLVLPADIPLITSSDVNQIINLCSGEKCIVIAPSRNGGTNVLLQKPPNLITPFFGPKSFSRHLAEASSQGIMTRIYRSQNVTRDIDSPEDLESLLKIGVQTVSYRFLRRVHSQTSVSGER